MAKRSTKEEKMYLRIRNLVGILGIILPFLALFSAGIAEHTTETCRQQWWWSISATYYLSPALVGVLVPACIVLISYIGYDWTDNLITTLAGLFGLGIVLFPCAVKWIEPGTTVGFFQLPMEASHIIHTVCACLFFLCIALNSLLQFTKHGAVMTEQKVLRNRIYRVCGFGMLGLMVLFALTKLLGAPGWTVMVIEIFLLFLYGFAWLVKGEAFPFLNDKPEQT
jgi:hypothetical protein